MCSCVPFWFVCFLCCSHLCSCFAFLLFLVGFMTKAMLLCFLSFFMFCSCVSLFFSNGVPPCVHGDPPHCPPVFTSPVFPLLFSSCSPVVHWALIPLLFPSSLLLFVEVYSPFCSSRLLFPSCLSFCFHCACPVLLPLCVVPLVNWFPRELFTCVQATSCNSKETQGQARTNIQKTEATKHKEKQEHASNDKQKASTNKQKQAQQIKSKQKKAKQRQARANNSKQPALNKAVLHLCWERDVLHSG